MKVLSIAFKDLLQQFRSTFAIGMMFGAPLLITGLIYFAFSGMIGSSGGEQTYSLPVIAVQIVNHDQGEPAYSINAGQILTDHFKGDNFKDIFSVQETQDGTAAKSAVDQQQAAVAILIPENFTKAVLAGDPVEVTIYQDPTLTFGPGLVKEIVSQFVDGFTGTQIARSVMKQQFEQRGQVVDPAMLHNIQVDYSQYVQSHAGENDWAVPVTLRAPQSEAVVEEDPISKLLGPTMAGMLIFFVFFTGANSARGIIREHEEGTLARLYTTPTPVSTILGGKFASVLLMLTVQSIVLLVASSLIFKINWGGLPQISLAVIGLVAASAGFGILLISFVKTTQQAGAVIGGVLTVMGMLGGLMTASMPNIPAAFDLIGSFVPQGWAMRAIKLALSGASLTEMLLPTLALLAMGAIFFLIGSRIFRNRFA